MVGEAVPSSAACWTVHLPVPLDPVWSTILSTRKPSPYATWGAWQQYADGWVLQLKRVSPRGQLGWLCQVSDQDGVLS
jgi:hypothetical protein